ncbi:MAG: hypothetical protein IT492_11910 [Gammaproteobacteria bacterium]|nr:hypothetical protein [Gammaproteobacteria bacterium]
MAWYSYRPYVTVADRRRKAQATARKLAKQGRVLAPVELASSRIATTFWGKAWCKNLEDYSDFANRLPRGRTYVRNGAIIDLQITTGQVEALVQGSELYRVVITFKRLAAKRWQGFKKHSAGKFVNLLDLLQGRLSQDILATITSRDNGLFPAPLEIKLGCSCPDWATMCKHVAAVLYGVGARLDQDPELFFILRGVDMQELMKAATASAVRAPKGRTSATAKAIADQDLSEIFGVEIETAPPATARPRKRGVKMKSTAKRGQAAAQPESAKKTKPVAKAKPRKPHAHH